MAIPMKKPDKEEKSIWKRLKPETRLTRSIAGAGVGLGIAAGGFLLAPVVLGAIGFSSAGVVGGSIAAGVQASIGNVVAGSAFATLQSVGAAGFAASTVAATTATTAAAGVALGAAIPGNNNSVGDNEDNDNVSNDTDSGFDTAFGLNQTVVGSEESLFDRLLCVSRVNTQKIMRRNSF